MADSGAQFAVDIKQYCEQTKRSLDRAVRAILFEVFGRIVARTPVWSGGGHAGGAARNNWHVGYDTMPTGKVGAGATPNLYAALQPKIVGHVVWFVNNLPYIGVLEYGGYPNPPKYGSWTGKGWVQYSAGGFSKQAPAGMVRVTLQEISDAVNKGIAESKNG